MVKLDSIFDCLIRMYFLNDDHKSLAVKQCRRYQ